VLEVREKLPGFELVRAGYTDRVRFILRLLDERD
jgi:hypothetical protein